MTDTTIKFLIIDDEPIAHRIILNYCKSLTQLELVGQCYNAIDGLNFIKEHDVDLVFLDVNMPQLTGFEMLRTLPKKPYIIVTTAHDEHALEGYELSVSDFLVKPFSLERFLQAVQKVENQLAIVPISAESSQTKPISKIPETLFVKVDKVHHQVHISDIQYIEACGNYCILQLQDRKLMTLEKISSYEQKLPENEFFRVHKSFIVATKHISAIAKTSILIGNKEIPIGQTFKKRVHEILTNSLPN